MYVVGGAPWQQVEDYPEWISNKNVYVLNSFSDKITSILLAKEIKKKVYRYPTVQGLDYSKYEERVFSAIFRNEKDFLII